ncbi:MAG: GNAT family N-acetyltransferase [Actinomycetota bacterium]
MADNPLDNPLDNPVWHAVTGPQRELSLLADPEVAGRFEPDVSVFGATVDLEPPSWDALASVLDGENVVGLLRPHEVQVPEGWRSFAAVPCRQYVAESLPDGPPIDLTELGSADAPDMQALVELTEPGPFSPRTHEMGTYLGLRRDGALVAMAGQRLRLPGHVEISAVCVHPDARREGLGAAFTLAVAGRIRAAGDEAFLHVRTENAGAIELYERLGFRHRRDIIITVVAPERPA